MYITFPGSSKFWINKCEWKIFQRPWTKAKLNRCKKWYNLPNSVIGQKKKKKKIQNLTCSPQTKEFIKFLKGKQLYDIERHAQNDKALIVKGYIFKNTYKQ